MTILDNIIEHKYLEVKLRSEQFPLHLIVEREYYSSPTRSLKNKLKAGPGIIAEFKRKSPSKGTIRSEADVVEITQSYGSAGAAACSILTDNDFFGGSALDILMARPKIQIPILRKEFIIDPYQIHEAKALGADLILLIAECLTKQQIKDFTTLAHDLGLEVLMELHFEEELDKWYDQIDLIGVNNRNLKTFETGIAKSIELAPLLPHESVWVSESGLKGSEEISALIKIGFKGFLIGETLMKAPDPGLLCQKFVQNLTFNSTHAE